MSTAEGRGLTATPTVSVDPPAVEVEPAAGRASVPWHVFDTLSKALIASALAAMVAILFANAIDRAAFSGTLAWSSEVSEIALVVVTFVGSAVAYHDGHHLEIGVLRNKLPVAARPFIAAFGNWFVIVICAGLAWNGYHLLSGANSITSAVLEIPLSWPLAVMDIGMLFAVVYAVRRLVRLNRPAVVVATAIAVLAVLVVGWALSKYAAVAASPSLIIGGICALVLLAVGVPIAFVFSAGAFIYAYLSGAVPANEVASSTFDGTQGELLLAVPLFLLAGTLMTAGGLTKPLSEVLFLLVGRFRGAVLHIVVITTYLFSGVSGAKIADITAVGSAMEDMVVAHRYSRSEMAAVLSASGAMGETIPPSIGLLVLGSATSLSIGTLFLAGIIPAAVVGVCLMVLVYVRARRQPKGESPEDMPGGFAEWSRSVCRTGLRALPVLFVPVLLVGGIGLGWATPTEASSFAVVYAMILIVIINRRLRNQRLWDLFIETGVLSGMLMFIIATAHSFSQILTISNIPQRLVTGLGSIASNSTVFLLLVVPCLVLIGMVLEGVPGVLLLAPLLLPAAQSLGIGPIHFGIVLLLSLGLGAFMPPIGIGLYAACAVSKVTVEQVARPMLGYAAILVVGILIVAFVPKFTLFLPQLVGVS